MLWHKLYYETLQNNGFDINPYDKYAVNNVINRKQCILARYVDENKLSHVEKKVVDEILEILKRDLGYLNIQQGKKFAILGINIMITNNKKV